MNESATLSALRLSDSFLPVGSFTASYGLEQFVQSGRVEDGDDLRALLESYLRGQVGPCEMVALGCAHEATAAGDPDRVAAVDQRVRAVTLVTELRESSTKSGRRLLELEAETGEDEFVAEYAARVEAGEAPGNYAVALGTVAAREGIPAREARLLHGYSFCSNLLGVAQRLLRLGHTESQLILRDLRPVVREEEAGARDRSVDDVEPFAPGIDLASMAHERADRRLFMS